VKALSIRQPWAYAILHLGKDVENRDWFRKFMIGETFAIHASASMTAGEFEAAYHFIKERIGPETAEKLPMFAKEFVRGAIIGTARITHVISAEKVKKGLPVSKWFVGEYGLVFDQVRPLPEPIPCAGKLMFWEVPTVIVTQINKQLGK